MADDVSFDLIIPPTSTGGGGGPPTGTAGGSLAGTYPNPTLAGRDTSTDALNKDLLPGLLDPAIGVIVIPAPAPTGAASGSLIGTYPAPTFAGRDSSVDKINQDMLPAMLADPNGVVTYPAPGSAPTGAAGGSLAGTYPNPTFAGRDASVDQLNRDLLPQLLTDALGVVTIPAATGGAPSGAAGGSLAGTYPNPTLAGRDASVDKINQDLLPSLFVPQPGGALVLPGVGAFGQSPISDSKASPNGTLFGQPDALAGHYYKIAGSYETFAKTGATVGARAAAASGTVILMAIALPKNFTVTKIAWLFSAAGVTMTHWWFALTDQNFLQLRATADQTSAAIGATAFQDIALASTFTTTYEGLYYVAYMVAATTPPTPTGVSTTTQMNAGPPILLTAGLTAQTTPAADGTNLAPAPAAGIVNLYAYVH